MLVKGCIECMVNIVCLEELIWVYSKHLGCASILGELYENSNMLLHMF